MARWLTFFSFAQVVLLGSLSLLPVWACWLEWQQYEVAIRTYLAVVVSVIGGGIALGNNEIRIQLGDEIKACKAKLLLSEAHRLLAERLKVNAERIGLHVYVVRRRARYLYRARQVRFARHRAKGNTHPEMSLKWPRKVGVVGLCWEAENNTITWRKIDSQDALKCQDKLAWKKLDPNQTLGFSFKQRGLLSRYAGIIAQPIKVEANGSVSYIGCVTLDILDAEDLDKLLDSSGGASQAAAQDLKDLAADLGDALA